MSEDAVPSPVGDAHDEAGDAAPDAGGYDVDSYTGYKVIDAGHCETESYVPGVTGAHCCDGKECNGYCVVPIIAPESTPVCWCARIVGGCPVGGELICCGLSAAV